MHFHEHLTLQRARDLFVHIFKLSQLQMLHLAVDNETISVCCHMLCHMICFTLLLNRFTPDSGFIFGLKVPFPT